MEDLLDEIRAITGPMEVALSVVSVMELRARYLAGARRRASRPPTAVLGRSHQYHSRLSADVDTGAHSRPDRRGVARSRHSHRFPGSAYRRVGAGAGLWHRHADKQIRESDANASILQLRV